MIDLELKLPAGALRQFKTLQRVSRVMAAKSLTFTAEKAVPKWRAGHAVFHRRNSFIDKGVRLRAATPSNMTAQVGTIDKWMGRHVKGVGERKRATSGRLFVPRYDKISDVHTHLRERSRLRRMGVTKRKPFVVGDKLLRRTGKKPTPLVVLGYLRKSVKIEPRLDAVGIVEDVVRREYSTLYQRLLRRWAETGRT